VVGALGRLSVTPSLTAILRVIPQVEEPSPTMLICPEIIPPGFDTMAEAGFGLASWIAIGIGGTAQTKVLLQ
jgi:hypothetical protein